MRFLSGALSQHFAKPHVTKDKKCWNESDFFYKK